MKLKTLIRLWLWVTAMAIAAFAVLAVLENKLKATTGFGVVDLQSARTAFEYKRAFAAWIARESAAAVGFSLGFDFLFMPLYAISFYFSAMLVREAFTPKKGIARRLVDYLGFLPVVAAIADAVENSLEFNMFASGASDSIAAAAYTATEIKWVCFIAGFVLLLAAIPGVVRLRRPKKDEAA
jgi:hypothetical protein